MPRRRTRRTAAGGSRRRGLLLLLLLLLLRRRRRRRRRLVLLLRLLRRLLGGVEGLLGRLLAVGRLLPDVVAARLRERRVVRHEDVVEDGARVDGPELKADVGEVAVDGHVLVVVLVGQLLGHPLALVGRVVDPLRHPLALVLRVVNLRRLPLPVQVLVPVRGLLGIGVGNHLGRLVPVRGLLVLRVLNLLLVHPVGRLRVRRVVHLPRGEGPVGQNRARGLLLAVKEHLVGVVGPDDEREGVRELVLLVVPVVPKLKNYYYYYYLRGMCELASQRNSLRLRLDRNEIKIKIITYSSLISSVLSRFLPALSVKMRWMRLTS